MAEPALVVMRDSRVPALAMANRFKGYKPMEPESVRKAEMAQNPVLEELKKAWKTYCFLPTGGGAMRDMPAPYISALGLVKGLSYSAKDVESFTIALGESQDIRFFGSRAGFFLSALINNGKDNDYIVHTRHLAPIHHFGYGNTKNIIVEGNLGSYAGTRMRCGSIIVKGDIGTEAGRYMVDGTIIVQGNAGTMVGRMMHGGVIIVKGNADDRIGWGASGDSVIYIEGEAGLILRPKESARIIHKGKLVYGKKF